MVSYPLTGVVRPLAPKSVELGGEVPLATSGWVLVIITLVIIVFIIFSLRREREKNKKGVKEETQELEMEEYGIEKCNEKLTDYITNALKRGYSANRIKDLLEVRGWSDKIVVSFINDIKKSSEV